MQETWVQSLHWGRSPGKGNGNPLQYSCLENPMNRGAWPAIAHGVRRARHGLVTELPHHETNPRSEEADTRKSTAQPALPGRPLPSSGGKRFSAAMSGGYAKARTVVCSQSGVCCQRGFLHCKPKQPVLKIGLKSSVWSQAEMKSDKFGQ